MRTSRCPHHVYHGVYNRKTQQMEFQDRCALLMTEFSALSSPSSSRSKVKFKGNNKNSKSPNANNVNKAQSSNSSPISQLTPEQKQKIECHQVPFDHDFDYLTCPTYQKKFKINGIKNNAVPSNDYHYSEQYGSSSFGDMEFL